MSHFDYKKWNLLLGWSAFTIALIVYALTAEPTVSFWDAGEYILTSSKLQVGHPPGAPLFQMLGAFFSVFALEPSQIGYILNLMSGVSSAFTVLFMFWTISRLLKILAQNKTPDSIAKDISILGAAFVGSLSFTFTDSFWFNAVETEVYAMATLIMAIMFYLGLRWQQDMHVPRGDKWLVLISFVTGLSFGVHFMGLLTIPAIVLIYFFKKYKQVTPKNFIVANLIGIAVLLFVFKLLAPNILRYFSTLEIFFVNNIGLPFNSGTIIAAILLVSGILYGLIYTHNKQYKQLNTALLCLTFITIGFMSWLMLPIRANANVIINENNPSSARELLAYYNLEQYPKTYLFYGPQFTDQYAGLDEVKPYVDDKPKYEKDFVTGKYKIVNDYKNASQNYNAKHASILPRMWSAEHAENYMRYSGFLDFTIKKEYQSRNEVKSLVGQFKESVANNEVDYEGYNQFFKTYGQFLDIKKPSLLQNIYYLFDYQIGYMYWRYFMWNFSGRQDDVQGKKDLHGNWLSGIKFIDEWHLGISQSELPSDVIKNKGRNTYYMLPLFLGIIGLVFLYNSDKKWFWVLLVFFLFTGIAIQVYTNVRPFEPRERDYSVVGSFYVFAMWIGFGVYALCERLNKWRNSKISSGIVILSCLIAVPGILIANNWDDHDRSGRETAHAMAVKYLESCDPNAILFTIGDNDTFPLWYAQEIEGIRRDVRVVNTSLFNVDWYIDQMKRKAYDSDPIPSQLTHEQYQWGTRDYIIKESITNDTIDIQTILEFITSNDKRTKYGYVLEQQGYDISGQRRQDMEANYIPTENIRIPVDKNSVLENNIVQKKDSSLIVPYIDIRISSSAIYKNRLLMLDVIANNNWERPIYFTGGAFGEEDYIWMKDYLQLDGLCYKLIPIKTPVDPSNPYNMGRVDSDKMYEMVMNWDWGNSNDPNIYHDIETRRNSITYRGNLARLMETLINENKRDKAEKIADLAMTKMPIELFDYYTLLEPFINGYYELEQKEKGRKLFLEVKTKYQESLNYYSHVSENNKAKLVETIYLDIERYRSLVDLLVLYEEEKFVREQMEEFNTYLKRFTGEEEINDETFLD